MCGVNMFLLIQSLKYTFISETSSQHYFAPEHSQDLANSCYVGNQSRIDGTWSTPFAWIHFFFLTFFLSVSLFLRISSFFLLPVYFGPVFWPWPPLFYCSCMPKFPIQKFSYILPDFPFPSIPLLSGGPFCLPVFLVVEHPYYVPSPL